MLELENPPGILLNRYLPVKTGPLVGDLIVIPPQGKLAKASIIVN